MISVAGVELDPKKMIEWLRWIGRRDFAGKSCTSNDCPVARWIKYELSDDDLDVFVDDRIGVSRDLIESIDRVKSPTWVLEIVDWVDKTYSADQDVPAEPVLRKLTEIVYVAE